MPEWGSYGSVRGAAGNSRPCLLSSSRTLHEHVELTFTRPETQFQEPPQPTTRSFSAVFANRALRRNSPIRFWRGEHGYARCG